MHQPNPSPPSASPYGFRLALLCLTAIRLLVAARAPLSADEAYYWVWSRTLAAGYLDHPPMVALWIRAGTAIAGQTALGIRLLGPIAALLGTLLLMRAAEDLAPGRRAGVAAACLLNATLMMGVGAVIITPDTPLLFFWTAALACLARLLRTGRANWWLAVGLCAGLALDSKYTALLLGLGIAAWLLAVPAARHWLRCWQLWAGVALALSLFAPVVAWNAVHGWASFAKQGGRTGDWQPARALGFMAELLGGQFGLATPLVALVLGAGLVRAGQGLLQRRAAPALLACLTLLPGLVFLQHALGGRVQANWPAILYPAAAIAGAGVSARFWKPACLVGAACVAVITLQVAFAPLALPRALDATLIRLAGWQDLAGQVYAARVRSGAALVVADEYGLASELAWRLPGGVVGVAPRWSMFDLPAATLDGRRVLLVRSVREAGGPDPRLWAEVADAGGGERARRGIVAETYRFYTARWSPAAGRAAPQAVRLPSPVGPS